MRTTSKGCLTIEQAKISTCENAKVALIGEDEGNVCALRTSRCEMFYRRYMYRIGLTGLQCNADGILGCSVIFDKVGVVWGRNNGRVVQTIDVTSSNSSLDDTGVVKTFFSIRQMKMIDNELFVLKYANAFEWIMNYVFEQFIKSYQSVGRVHLANTE